MQRVKFKKGEQRKFIQKVLEITNCPSLRSLLERVRVEYSTLKNYYSEERLLPKDFFLDLCYLSNISPDSVNVSFFEKNWGQIKGGSRKSKN